MSDAIAVALIASVPSTLAALVGFYNAMMTYRTKAAVEVLEKNTNSKMDALIKVTAESEFAKGVLAGDTQLSAETKRQEAKE